MRIISRHALVEFWNSHSDSQTPLAAWHQLASYASWQSFTDLRKTFPNADLVGRLTVFNVGGNKYRLIARVEFVRQRIYIRAVLTHADYDREDCKKDPWF
jgi:mRNA interferase HigB